MTIRNIYTCTPLSLSLDENITDREYRYLSYLVGQSDNFVPNCKRLASQFKTTLDAIWSLNKRLKKKLGMTAWEFSRTCRDATNRANKTVSSDSIETVTSDRNKLSPATAHNNTTTIKENIKEKPDKKRSSPIPISWMPSDSTTAWALNGTIGATNKQITEQTEQFIDHHKSKGNTFKDFDAAFKTWMRKAKQFGSLESRKPKPNSAFNQH